LLLEAVAVHTQVQVLEDIEQVQQILMQHSPTQLL
jgi:hypothetical protein